MQDYVSIPRGYIVKGKPIYAFDKLDGTQIRVEWNKKRKFWKYATKKHLISKSNGTYGEACYLIKEKYERDLHDVFVKERFQKAIIFCEFYGDSSFAGRHNDDEEHYVTLFDIRVKGKGILQPKEFIRLTKGIDTAKLLYHGNANEPFIESVRNRTLEGMTLEGVVCKSQEYKSFGIPIMFKLKSTDWYKRLVAHCSGDEKLYEELA